jgi:AraC-like DNA-binding protein
MTIEIATTEIATTTTLDFSEILPAERYEVWRESISVVFDIDSKTKIQPEVFNAELTTTHFSSILLNNTKSQGQNFNRSQKLIAQDDLDHFWLQMFIDGSSSVQWHRRQNAVVQTGDIFLIDFSQPFNLKSTDFEDINLIIPRHILQKYLPNVEKYHGAILPRDSVFAKILGSHLLTLKSVASTLSLSESSIIAEGVAHLAGLYFSQQAIPTDNYALQVATEETIKHYIRQNLTCTILTPNTIAAHFNISRAYLYRMFPEKGIATYIKEQRLKRAYRELQCLTDNRRISEIAFSLGFNSESDFSRSFQRFFQFTPSEVRYNAFIPSEDNLTINSQKERDFHFDDWVRKL